MEKNAKIMGMVVLHIYKKKRLDWFVLVMKGEKLSVGRSGTK